MDAKLYLDVNSQARTFYFFTSILMVIAPLNVIKIFLYIDILNINNYLKPKKKWVCFLNLMFHQCNTWTSY